MNAFHHLAKKFTIRKDAQGDWAGWCPSCHMSHYSSHWEDALEAALGHLSLWHPKHQ